MRWRRTVSQGVRPQQKMGKTAKSVKWPARVRGKRAGDVKRDSKGGKKGEYGDGNGDGDVMDKR